MAVGLVLGFIAAGVSLFWLRRCVLSVRNAPRDRRSDSRRSSRAPSRAGSLDSLPESAKTGRSSRSGRIPPLSAPFGRDEEAGAAEAGANPFGWFAWLAALFQPQHGAAPAAVASTATSASETSSGGSGVHRGKR